MSEYDKPFTSDVRQPLLKLAARKSEDDDIPDYGDFGPLYQAIQGIVAEDSFPAEQLMVLLLALSRADQGTRESLLHFGIEFTFPHTQRGKAAIRGCVADYEQGHVIVDTPDCLWVTANDNGELCLDVNIPYGDSCGFNIGLIGSHHDAAIAIKFQPKGDCMEATIITDNNDPKLSVKGTSQDKKQKKGGASK